MGWGTGQKNFWGDAYAAETRRLWNASAVWWIFCSKSYVILLWYGFCPQIWKWRPKNKIKKGLHRQILGYLITFTWSVLLFHKKKRLWWPVFNQKFATCATTKVYSRLGSTSSDLGGGHGPKSPPPVHRRSQDFWFGGRAKPKMTCNDVIRNFRKRNFLWDKGIVECN